MLAQRTRRAHGMKVPWVTLGLSAVLISLHAAPGSIFSDLAFDRAAIFQGELWRLATGHLVHLDWSHLAANVAALLCLGSLVESGTNNGRRSLLTVLSISVVTVSIILLATSPATAFYAGLSGALNGLFAYVCLHFYARTRNAIWPLLLIGDLVKIGWETVFGPIMTAALAWPPEPLAHFAGFLAGLGIVVARLVRHARKSWYFPWAACPLISA